MSRELFLKQLAALKQGIVQMAALTEEGLKGAFNVFLHPDAADARRIMEGDDVVDRMEADIENRCITLNATQQPLAKDLRLITAVLKMITDIERIADHASDIAEIVLQQIEESAVAVSASAIAGTAQGWIPFPDTGLFTDASGIALRMFVNAIHAYIFDDVKMAEAVCEEDNLLDARFREAVDLVADTMVAEPSHIRQAISWLYVIKYIERIGDHATNIAEWVIYHVTGEHRHYN
jgi:phosphate transport system protein